MLFVPALHETLCDVAWDAARARKAVGEIVRDIERSRTDDGQWPVHPLDEPPAVARTGFKGLYIGSAGVLWALWYLRRQDAVALERDPVEGLRRADAAYASDPDDGEILPSYYLGEAGILAVLWRATGSARVADRLYAAVASNIENPANEALWGAPGTMLAAWHLWEATAEQRWRDLFVANVDALWRTWTFDAKAGCHLWTQGIHAKPVQYLGAAHGFAGNVHPLLKGAALLDATRRETLYDRCAQTLRAMARIEDGGVNWPEGTYVPRPDAPGAVMQWCHGAPGIVTAVAEFPRQRSADVDTLLVGAGHAVWAAGPLVKGYGLCHGTAGNGYAFLKLYRRTGDDVWLQRARAFAMHSIAQRQRMRQRHQRGRYTLWTGDAGLAVYLWHCLDGTASLPALDALQ